MSLPTVDQPGFNLKANPDEGYDYRPLKRTTPIQKGWDVYALQTALVSAGYELAKYGADGYLGDETAAFIWYFQKKAGIKQDGIAGIQTQRELCQFLIRYWTRRLELPPGLLYGQIEKESGFQIGNFTPVYENTGRRDLGVVQQNVALTTNEARRTFNVGRAVGRLANDPERGLRSRANTYRSFVHTDQRAWELAAGSWNAPAWANALAYGWRISDTNRASIEAYIDRVTSYVTSWPTL